MVIVTLSKHIREHGYALVIVLWLTALLTFVAATAYSAARTEVQLTTASTTQAKGRSLADAGVWLTIQSILETDLAKHSQFTHTNRNLTFEGATIEIEVRDEAGKVNLNYTSQPLLYSLLTSSSVSSDEAEALSFAIIDWIDSDSDSVYFINESQPYRNSDLLQQPKNKPFSTVDELRLVVGMTDEYFRAIEPFLTVYGSHAFINVEAAEENLTSRLRASTTESHTSAETNNDALYSSTPSGIFEITSRVRINNILSESVATVQMTNKRVEPYRILSWEH